MIVDYVNDVPVNRQKKVIARFGPLEVLTVIVMSLAVVSELAHIKGWIGDTSTVTQVSLSSHSTPIIS